MYDQQAVDTWIYGVLSGDSALVALLPNGVNSIYNVFAPAGTFPPYVIYNAMPSQDIRTNGCVRLAAVYNVTVQIVTQDTVTNKLAANAIAALFDTDMFTRGTSQNSFWITAYRTKGINLGPNMKDRLYRYVGGNYQVTLRPITQPS